MPAHQAPAGLAAELAEAETRIAAAEGRLAEGRALRAHADGSLRAELARERAAAQDLAAEVGSLRGELASLRAAFEEARTMAAREIGALYQRMDRLRSEAAERGGPPRPPDPVCPPAPRLQERALVVARVAPVAVGAWLSRAARALALEDPDAGAALLAGLARAGGLTGDAEGGRFRLAGERFAAEGEAAAVAELLAGGRVLRARLQRRLAVRGARRARRALAALDPATAPDPLLALRALALLVEPAWTGERRFAVAVATEAGELTLAADRGVRADDVPAATRVEVPADGLRAWLGGAVLEAPVAVRGEREPARLLASWGQRVLAAG